jgi:hypothetical protein
MIFDTMARVITKDKNIIYITRYSFIVNFLVHFSLYVNGLLTAKLLSHFIIVRGIPFIIILITNIFLIDGLIKKSRRKKEMTSDSAESQMHENNNFEYSRR